MLGAGAAGLMCASVAGQRGRSVLVLEQARHRRENPHFRRRALQFHQPAYQPRRNFLSDNPHFCISALSRYTQQDFIALVDSYGIAHHEKT